MGTQQKKSHRKLTILELEPQRKLPDAVATGVTEARGLNLSECAQAGVPVNLSQVVARIVEVRVVGQIGEAALELQPKSLREPEVFGESQRQVNCSRANQRPDASVAKAANDAAVGEAWTIKRVVGQASSWGKARAGVYVRIPILRTSVVKVIGIAAANVRPVKTTKLAIAGGVKKDEGSIVGAGLHQKNRTQPPTADNPVQHSAGITEKGAPFPDREFVHHGGDPAMFAGTTGVAVIGVHVVQVHFVASNFPGKAGAGPRFDVRQVLRPGPGTLEGEPVGVLVDQLRLHGLIAANGTGATASDLTPGWERCRPGHAIYDGRLI